MEKILKIAFCGLISFLCLAQVQPAFASRTVKASGQRAHVLMDIMQDLNFSRYCHLKTCWTQIAELRCEPVTGNTTCTGLKYIQSGSTGRHVRFNLNARSSQYLLAELRRYLRPSEISGGQAYEANFVLCEFYNGYRECEISPRHRSDKW